MKIIESVKIKAKKLLGAATWVFVVFLLISTAKNINRVAGIRSAVQKEKDRVEKMKEENARLEAQVTQMQGDAYIEKQIRDKLGLARQGEVIVVLPDAEVLRKLAPQIPAEENTLPDPNWKKWIKLFN